MIQSCQARPSPDSRIDRPTRTERGRPSSIRRRWIVRKGRTLTEGASQSYADSATDQGMRMSEMARLLAFNIGVPHLAIHAGQRAADRRVRKADQARVRIIQLQYEE